MLPGCWCGRDRRARYLDSCIGKLAILLIHFMACKISVAHSEIPSFYGRALVRWNSSLNQESCVGKSTILLLFYHFCVLLYTLEARNV